MIENASERVEHKRCEERAVEDLRAALSTLMDAGREVGALTLKVAERQLDVVTH
jgi:hypothetical protein